MTHLDTIPAMQAAFQLGRAEYLRLEKLVEYDCSKALAAYRKFVGEIESNPEFAPVIGGGNSLTGRIKWLLENRGAMTRSELDDALNADTTQTVATLKYRGELSSEGRGVNAKFSIRKAVAV